MPENLASEIELVTTGSLPPWVLNEESGNKCKENSHNRLRDNGEFK